MIVTRKKRIVIPPLDADTYQGTLIGVVDIGDQEFKQRLSRKCLLIFEIAEETVEIEGEIQPRWLSREVTASIDKKSNLYQILTSWLGADIEDDKFDLTPLIGLPALLNIVVKTSSEGNPYNFIQSVMKPMKGMKVPKPQSELIDFSMDVPETWATLEKLPEWIRDKIEKSPTWADLHQNTGEVISPETFKSKERQPGF